MTLNGLAEMFTQPKDVVHLQKMVVWKEQPLTCKPRMEKKNNLFDLDMQVPALV